MTRRASRQVQYVMSPEMKQHIAATLTAIVFHHLVLHYKLLLQPVLQTSTSNDFIYAFLILYMTFVDNS